MDAAQKVGKLRIGAKSRKVHQKIPHPKPFFADSFVQPVKSLILIAKPQVNHCYVVRSNEFLFGVFQDFSKKFLRFVSPPGHSISVGKLGHSPGTAALDGLSSRHSQYSN